MTTPVQWPPLTCGHRSCRAHARNAVIGPRASYPACDDHIPQIRAKCGEPCTVRLLDDAAEPDQPTLYDDGGTAA